MLTRRWMLRASALTAALALTACGATEAPSGPAAPDAAGGGPVTVTDARGKTVTLPRPATKVVGLEWGEIEMLVSLRVMLVGVADRDGYATWVTAAKLDSTVNDVGLRGEPSVDSIVALQPDLVITEAEGMDAQIAQLEQYVPVLVTKGSDASDNLGRLRSDLNLIATAVGKQDAAAKLLADLDAALADGRQKIAAASSTKGYAMADGWRQGSAISIRMFGQGPLVSDLATQLGLQNAWNGEVDAVWGLGTTDVEGLTTIKDADVRFFYNASGDEDVFADGLTGNALWQSYAFVQKGQVHKLPNGIWTFGGPLSCQQYIEALVKAYAG
jgi:ABC-type Fe3+-hydroxamate transport system substrate-binding protein